MSEDIYRRVKSVLLAVLVLGSLFIGWRWSENGRYQLVDFRKTGSRVRPLPVMDTRTGEIQTVDWKD
ncbi:hypothetical protein [Fimbriiglobus ruber]|uniref:Uncharacterized protein n=1 Tax=Fimbriiglobus ruber TaxID=1908690 RepID=A0A225DH18_9BACT|nr:hypothetical protein [Fimbriiglobus ruber]OWK37828.1 hypothetical protein FRUB_06948 [Fimbriiglobus ruber]